MFENNINLARRRFLLCHMDTAASAMAAQGSGTEDVALEAVSH